MLPFFDILEPRFQTLDLETWMRAISLEKVMKLKDILESCFVWQMAITSHLERDHGKLPSFLTLIIQMITENILELALSCR